MSMSVRTWLQDHPAPLVLAWRLTETVFKPIGPTFERLGIERSSWMLNPFEDTIKHLLFNCQECGQCVLHYTGMTCPMNCPKQIRNGPCGGVRLNGKCEVYPERDCVWVKGWERIPRTPWARELYRLNPPVDWRLEGMSSWVTMSTKRDQVTTGVEQGYRYGDEVLEVKK
jgi:hypothetical protein